jgi:hypothetical protein
VPVAIARLSNGMVAYVTFDHTLVRDHFAAKAYLSVVDSRTGRSCPDARIPVPEDPAPSIAIRGDTLVVASQEIAGTSAQSWLRRFLIDVRNCGWVGG